VLPWRQVVSPAVRVARHGFPVGEDLVKFMNVPMADGHDFLIKDPAWAEDFAPHGKLLELGDTITRKRYAK
jgi:gamma-glutamyltranspeptidase / glutathione hydrolase